MEISTNFPGGNAIIKYLGNNQYEIEPDQRNGTMTWFYWCFKMINPQSNTYLFHLKKGCMTSKGYAISFDHGLTWKWADPNTINENTISFQAPENTPEVILSIAMTYTLNNWHSFLKNLTNITLVNLETLCITRNGRTSPLLKIKNNNANNKIIITARHHCCEMMANYTLEGMIKYVLENCTQAKLENIEFVFIPFVDLDGVEEGDQGKGRAPYDHNRDYGEKSIYPEIPAIKFEVNKNKKQNLITFDCHCPTLKGKWNEQVYIVGSPFERIANEEHKLLKIIEEENDGIIPFGPKNFLPYGEEWNKVPPGLNNSSWCGAHEHVKIAASIEIPYGNAEGRDVTQDSARKLGEVIIRSMIRYLKT